MTKAEALAVIGDMAAVVNGINEDVMEIVSLDAVLNLNVAGDSNRPDAVPAPYGLRFPLAPEKREALISKLKQS